MSGYPRVLVHPQALRHNLAVARRIAPGCPVMAVVKADGYGHGLAAVREGLASADAFAVARVDEGVTLRAAGCQLPIVVLEGAMDAAEQQAAAAHGLALVLHRPAQIDLAASATAATSPGVPDYWLKVDSGMHRLGVPPAQAGALLERFHQALPQAPLPGLMTHLANADDPDDDYTRVQLARFLPVAERLGTRVSVANSAGLLGWADARRGWLRPGLMLYGASPLATRPAATLGLRPAMTLQARLIAIQHYAAGEPIGYGGTWRCPEAMPVGVLGIGYGDGYPRSIPSGTPVHLHGQRLPVVGRISMDMTTIDLRGCPQARVGDVATLWGEGLPVEEIASAAGTLPYTLLCGITARVHRAPLAAE